MEFQLTSKSRWPEELTCKFVDLYKGFDCLWNIHSPEYKDKYLKRMAYENMAESIGIQGFGINDVRTKIRNLRGTYQQEIMKIEKSKLRNDGNYIYVPNMKWFTTMHEIMTFIKNNSGENFLQNKSKVKLEAKPSEEPEDEFEEQFYEYLEDDIHFEDSVLKGEQEIAIPNEDTSSSSQATVPTNQTVTSPTTEAPPKSSSNFSFISCGYSNTNSRKKKLHETTPNEESPPEKKQDLELWDECSTFGKYIGISLKKLPVEYSIQAQQEIQEILTRYRLLAMKTNSNASGTSKT